MQRSLNICSAVQGTDFAALTVYVLFEAGVMGQGRSLSICIYVCMDQNYTYGVHSGSWLGNLLKFGHMRQLHMNLATL